jgi:hypothetical protein
VPVPAVEVPVPAVEVPVPVQGARVLAAQAQETPMPAPDDATTPSQEQTAS